jgi:hypothetical protein
MAKLMLFSLETGVDKGLVRGESEDTEFVVTIDVGVAVGVDSREAKGATADEFVS